MRRYRRNPLTAGRIIDGQAFVVTSADNRLHTLNSTASELWRRAPEGFDLDAATAMMVATFEIDEEIARRDIEVCLADLVERKILDVEEA